MRRLLERQCRRLGLAPPVFTGRAGGYFAAQAAAFEELRDQLAERYGALDDDLTRAQFQLRRAMREREAGDPEGVQRDRGRLQELVRLASFDPALYGRPRLSQERVAEVLKRMRSSLLTRGLRNALHNTLPIAAGPRDVHVRVPEPVAVHAAWSADAPEGGAPARTALLAEHRSRLQGALDRLGRELEDRAERFAVDNPLHQG
jgi:hypothetical protein